MKTCITIIFLLLLAPLSAQNDTIFFDKNWKTSNKEIAFYYRVKPIKVKTKDAVGYKIKNIDSLFIIKDYYLENNQLQFQGYSSDYQGKYLIGKAEWFNVNGKIVDANNYNYREKKNTGFKIPDWPILYLDYRVASKSLLTAGLEFCLDCKNENKLLLGTGFGVTNSYNGNYYGLPDLHVSYNIKSLFFKTGTSHKNAYLLSGLTFLNVIDLGLGYSFPYTNEKMPVYKGFITSLTLRFSNNKKAFGQFKIM